MKHTEWVTAGIIVVLFIISGGIAYLIVRDLLPMLFVLYPVIASPIITYIFQLKIKREEKRLIEKTKAYEKFIQSLNEVIHKGLYKGAYEKEWKDIEKQLNDAYASIILHAPDKLSKDIKEICAPITEMSTKTTLEEKVNQIRLILKTDLNEKTTLTLEDIKYLKIVPSESR